MPRPPDKKNRSNARSQIDVVADYGEFYSGFQNNSFGCQLPSIQLASHFDLAGAQMCIGTFITRLRQFFYNTTPARMSLTATDTLPAPRKIAYGTRWWTISDRLRTSGRYELLVVVHCKRS